MTPAHRAIKLTFNVEGAKMSAQLASMSSLVASRDPFKVTRVVDGDTLAGEIMVQLSLTIPTVGVVMTELWLPVTVRLRHVNAPEKNTDAGKHAIEYVQAWLSDAEEIGALELEYDGTREKYGRLLGVVWASEHKQPKQTLNESLLVDGIGQPYEGGKR